MRATAQSMYALRRELLHRSVKLQVSLGLLLLPGMVLTWTTVLAYTTDRVPAWVLVWPLAVLLLTWSRGLIVLTREVELWRDVCTDIQPEHRASAIRLAHGIVTGFGAGVIPVAVPLLGFGILWLQGTLVWDDWTSASVRIASGATVFAGSGVPRLLGKVLLRRELGAPPLPAFLGERLEGRS